MPGSNCAIFVFRPLITLGNNSVYSATPIHAVFVLCPAQTVRFLSFVLSLRWEITVSIVQRQYTQSMYYARLKLCDFCLLLHCSITAFKEECFDFQHQIHVPPHKSNQVISLNFIFFELETCLNSHRNIFYFPLMIEANV